MFISRLSAPKCRANSLCFLMTYKKKGSVMNFSDSQKNIFKKNLAAIKGSELEKKFKLIKIHLF